MCILQLLFFIRDSGTKDEGSIRILRDDLVVTTEAMMDMISGMMDDHILDTNLADVPLSEILPKGEVFCSKYHLIPDLSLYCRFRENQPDLERTRKNDTCQQVMDFRLERWEKLDNITRAMIKKCMVKQQKTLVFGHLNRIHIPIDFVTNKYRKWTLLQKFINHMNMILRAD